MKAFLFKTAAFFALLILVFYVSGFIVSKFVEVKASFAIQDSTKHIVIGHSHAECTYNDSLINDFENFAISGESYFYTLPKLKMIIDQNPNVKTVFLEFTNNQITENVDDWIWEEKYLSYYYAIYAPFISFEDKWLIIKNKPVKFFTNLPIVFKDLLKKTIQSNFNYAYEYGGFKKLSGNLDEYNSSVEVNTSEDFVKINDDISKTHIAYLLKIIDFLKQKNIQVFLIRSPQHAYYQGYENEDKFKFVLDTYLKEVPFLDLSRFPLTNNEFRDPEHINEKGAEIVSIWLNNNLMNNKLQDGFSIKKHIEYSEI